MKHTILTLTIASLLATTAFADPIHNAAASGNLAGVQAELDKGVDVNEANSGFYNLAPLHYAAGYGYKELAELLIAEGADVDAKTTTGGTPLFNAVGNNKEIVELLIANGADVNAQVVPGPHEFNVGDTPLDFSGTSEIIDLIRKHGGMTGVELRSGMTPLHQAARDGHKEIVEQLIDKGADVNAKAEFGETPLHAAVSNDHKEIAELLIKEGADVNAVAMDDVFFEQTPLDAANKYNQGAVAVLFRKYGGKTCVELEALIDSAKKGDIEGIKQHLAAGGDVSFRNKNGDTMLNYAAFLGHKEIVELLVENGVEVNAKGLADWTPLHLAAHKNNEQIVQLLIAKGAEMNPYTSPGFGGTPLDVADGKIADLLRKHGGKTRAELKAEGK